jgi:hypothetical protein
MQNAYWRKTIGGLPFLFLTLEFATNVAPDDYTNVSDVIIWANGVLASHPNDLVVLVTHGYFATYPSIDGHGQYVWDNLIWQHPNVVMVFCGHWGPTRRNQRPNQTGGIVNELQFDYQGWDDLRYSLEFLSLFNGPFRTSAIARLMTIDPLSNRVRVKQWGCEMGGWLKNLPAEPMDADEFRLAMDPRQ